MWKAASPRADQMRHRIPVAAVHARVHVFGGHRAQLLERLDHAVAAHRLDVAFDEGLLEEVDVHAVDDDLEDGRVGPVRARMRDADLAGGHDLVAGGVELGPGLRHLGDAGLCITLGDAHSQLMR